MVPLFLVFLCEYVFGRGVPVWIWIVAILYFGFRVVIRLHEMTGGK